MLNMAAEKTDLKQVRDSLAVLKAVGDPTVVNEAEKLEKAVNNLVAINEPLIANYAKELKAFDESVVSKYGLPTARVIEFVMVALVALKMYCLG